MTKNPVFRLEVRLTTPKSLQLSHDEACAELVCAATEGGPIEIAAERLAQLCLPHFEREEKFVFPILSLLPELTRGNLRPEMAEVLPLVSEFMAMQAALDKQHQSIQAAIDALLLACHREKNTKFAEFAFSLRVHERMEDEIIYPAVLLIGNFLRERLTM